MTDGNKSILNADHTSNSFFCSYTRRLLFGRLGFVETCNFEVRACKRKSSVADVGPSAKRSRPESAWAYGEDRRLLTAVLRVQSVQQSVFDKIAAAVTTRTAYQCYRRFTDALQHFNVRPGYLAGLRATVRVARQQWTQSGERICVSDQNADQIRMEKIDGYSGCEREARSDLVP